MVLETSRLRLREAQPDDAPFILQLVNEPVWLRHVGDRGIRTLEAAREYILNVLGAAHREHGFGLWLAEHRESSRLVGMCGLIKRPVLADVDLGFAFLAEYQRQGYALEAARATMDHAAKKLVERPAPTPTRPQHLCLDRGYDYEQVRLLAQAFGFVAHVRSRGEEAAARERQPGQKARRWVVERTHAWMNRFRSLLIRWAKKPANYEGLLHFACGLISYRAAGLFG